MSRWRLAAVAFLLLVPFVVLAGFGSWYLWERGLAHILWWPLAACFIAGYFLAWYWQRKRLLLQLPDFEPSLHWTERDQEAWKLVESHSARAAEIDPDRMSDMSFYVDVAKQLAMELARFYHPGADDPVGSLTLPEILAVTELASHDLARLIDDYLPGGHLITIRDWRRAQRMTDWYRTARKAYWLMSAVFSPVNTGLRYLAAELGMSRPLDMLQRDLIIWFYVAYVHRVGNYLIEVNSGRLRIGADRYRQLRDSQDGRAPEATGREASVLSAAGSGGIGLTIFGQVKTGKSSFVNALLGAQRAKTDVLPATDQVTRYELRPAGIDTRLSLFDTAGYGHTGPREDQMRATEEAARQSDLLVLALHARNPARRADAEILQRLRAWFASRPELRMPPVIAVMTHIDLLSPSLEWSPPYDWLHPERPKEKQIHEAVQAAERQLGELVSQVIPVCTAPGKIYGVEEWFLAALVSVLDEARAVAFLRCIKAETGTGSVGKLFGQLLRAGREVSRILRQMQHP
jgi:predicted GTPase